jgi:hypothetical protein
MTQGSPGRPTNSSITLASSPELMNLDVCIVSAMGSDRFAGLPDAVASGGSSMAVTPRWALNMTAEFIPHGR